MLEMDLSHPKHQRSQSQNNPDPIAHSTPSKMKQLRFSDSAPMIPPRDAELDHVDGSPPPIARFVFHRHLPSQSSFVSLNRNGNNSEMTDMDRETIVKQRTELQLLIGELKDRDRELNEMVQTHQQHMKSWEDDRQRTLNLETRCSKFERDLNKRNSQIRELLKKLKLVEAEASETNSALIDAQNRLEAALNEHTTTYQQLKELESYNVNLQQSFKEVSHTLGDTQAKVSELQKQLAVKEQEAVRTSKEVTDLASRLQSLEYAYKHLEQITFEVKSSANDWKNKYHELKQSADTVQNELELSNATLDEKDEELERLRKELKSKHNELKYSMERESRKDQLLALQKSKQERTDREISTLRQMYDLQQHKLTTVRQELVEIKERDIKHRANFSNTNFSQLNDSDGLLNSSGSAPPSPIKSQSPSHSRPRTDQYASASQTRNLPNSSESQWCPRTTSPPNHSSRRSPIKFNHEIPTHERYNAQASTDRLHKLLSDSNKLVDVIATNESKPPTHAMAQLSLSSSPEKT